MDNPQIAILCGVMSRELNQSIWRVIMNNFKPKGIWSLIMLPVRRVRGREKSKVTEHLPGLGREKSLSHLSFPLTTDIIFKILCYKPPNSLKYGKDLTTSLFYATSPRVLSNTSPQRFASHIMWILFMDLFISKHTLLDPWQNRKLGNQDILCFGHLHSRCLQRQVLGIISM